jgi:hypothetical protein
VINISFWNIFDISGLKNKIFIQVSPIKHIKDFKKPILYNVNCLKDFYEQSKIQPESGRKMPL